jgi:hypothetical protein
MTQEATPLKSSGNAEFDALAEMAVEAGFRVFPRTQQIVAADHASSGSAELSLARFAGIVEARVLERIAAKVIPDFSYLRDKRMSELTQDEQGYATELWIRDQLGSFPDYHREKLELLLKHLDVARAAVRDAAEAIAV